MAHLRSLISAMDEQICQRHPDSAQLWYVVVICVRVCVFSLDTR